MTKQERCEAKTANIFWALRLYWTTRHACAATGAPLMDAHHIARERATAERARLDRAIDATSHD